MNTTGLHPLAEAYLEQLRSAATALPPGDREELVAELRGHLEAGLQPDATEGQVRNMLGDLGSPEQIVAAAGGEPAAAPGAPRPWGTVEIIAVVGLTVGTFVVPVAGTFAGLVAAWLSKKWTRREKIVATVLSLLPVLLLILGGLGLVAGSAGSRPVDGGPAVSVEGGAR